MLQGDYLSEASQAARESQGRTQVIRIQVFAEISEARPSEDEKVDFGDEAPLFRAAVECVPDNPLDPVADGMLLRHGALVGG